MAYRIYESNKRDSPCLLVASCFRPVGICIQCFDGLRSAILQEPGVWKGSRPSGLKPEGAHGGMKQSHCIYVFTGFWFLCCASDNHEQPLFQVAILSTLDLWSLPTMPGM